MRYYCLSDKLGDKLGDKIGAELGEMLNLQRVTGRPDLWKTGWGTKTDRGLARTVLAVFDDAGVFDERTPADD